jgi:hypothetical protein
LLLIDRFNHARAVVDPKLLTIYRQGQKLAIPLQYVAERCDNILTASERIDSCAHEVAETVSRIRKPALQLGPSSPHGNAQEGAWVPFNKAEGCVQYKISVALGDFAPRDGEVAFRM